ncbi:MAG TPA: Lpg1974 family pore-forming outer membrane protein [Rhizomicrobium sp.]|nr:Lpg1974 family pore-forming outer membrane protein [Rhizomicrobium sp.]
MSEITNSSSGKAGFRANLLVSVSSAALLVAVYVSAPALASERDHPVVRIELGGALTQLDSPQQIYLPPFILATPRLPFITKSPADIERPIPDSWDGHAKITLQPSGMDWRLSAAVVYGRSARAGSQRQQTSHRSPARGNFGQYRAYQGATTKNTESHMILDFQAGQDVGLGLFGTGGHSTMSIGVRYAQLSSQNDISILYQPTNDRGTYHMFSGHLDARRRFAGIGPSLSWDASAGLIGNAEDGGASLDWGLNAAILFGRQRVQGHQRTNETAVVYPLQKSPIHQTSVMLNRSKQMIVPNLGGFAGISWRYSNAKVSLGYRADMFFGAIDGGIDTHKNENRGFYGPFASISVGLGD